MLVKRILKHGKKERKKITDLSNYQLSYEKDLTKNKNESATYFMSSNI